MHPSSAVALMGQDQAIHTRSCVGRPDYRRPLSLWTDSLCGTRRDQLSVGAGRTDPDPVAGDRSVSSDMFPAA